jgi:hypothetical protein
MVHAPAQHINGNCLLSGNLVFLRWLVGIARDLPGQGGWDYVLPRYFRQWGWANIDKIRSYYNSQTFSQEQYNRMREEELIWVHGDKSSILIDMGRKALLNAS